MSIVIPVPQFLHLSEPEILAALADPNPANPVACEVARLIAAYTGIGDQWSRKLA